MVVVLSTACAKPCVAIQLRAELNQTDSGRVDSGEARGRPASVAWSSTFAVYLGAAGASVGLGSIWRFPYLAGTGGGSAFILVFVLACMLVATPLLVAEFALGRAARLSPPEAAGAVAASA